MVFRHDPVIYCGIFRTMPVVTCQQKWRMSTKNLVAEQNTRLEA